MKDNEIKLIFQSKNIFLFIIIFLALLTIFFIANKNILDNIFPIIISLIIFILFVIIYSSIYCSKIYILDYKIIFKNVFGLRYERNILNLTKIKETGRFGCFTFYFNKEKNINFAVLDFWNRGNFKNSIKNLSKIKNEYSKNNKNTHISVKFNLEPETFF